VNALAAAYGLPYALHIDPYIPSGSLFIVSAGYFGRTPTLLARHFSEYAVVVAGATWHPRGHCPTWDDSTECRCMLGGEA
jgi:hypothetical protein